MKVNEIFKSIQGESSWAGLPCVFVRLSGCNLRCSYCDTGYAWEEGDERPVAAVLKEIKDLNCPLVEVTGGEPLLQEEAYGLTKDLLTAGYTVLVETNGALDISRLEEGVIRILDIKCPGSGMSERMYWPNLDHLRPSDEVKFVLCDRQDYQWAKELMKEYALPQKVTVLLSAAHGKLAPREVVEWMLADNLQVRFQLQLQKYIWQPGKRGV